MPRNVTRQSARQQERAWGITPRVLMGAPMSVGSVARWLGELPAGRMYNLGEATVGGTKKECLGQARAGWPTCQTLLPSMGEADCRLVPEKCSLTCPNVPSLYRRIASGGLRADYGSMTGS
jgi:hypothetical protein